MTVKRAYKKILGGWSTHVAGVEIVIYRKGNSWYADKTMPCGELIYSYNDSSRDKVASEMEWQIAEYQGKS